MFIIRPGDPLEVVVDVKTVRPVDLRVTMERFGGGAMLLGRRGPRDAEPVRVTIPPLDVGDRLRVELDVIGDEDEEDLLDLNVAFMQHGKLLKGSRHIWTERLASGVSRLVLDYRRLDAGVEMTSIHPAPAASAAPPSRPRPRPQPEGKANPQTQPKPQAKNKLKAQPKTKSKPQPKGAKPGPATLPPGPDALPPSERRINVWMAEREDEPATPLRLGETYTLCINVGLPVAASLVDDPEAEIPEDDIPAAGLPTEWVIQSSTAELQPLGDDVRVTRHEADGAPWWTARFDLHVLRGVDSPTVRLACIPRDRDARLRVLVYATNPDRPGRAELFRELEVALRVAGRARKPRAATASDAVRVAEEVMHSPVGHLNLRTTHEWTTPRNVLSVTVLGMGAGGALAHGDIGSKDINQRSTKWNAAPSEVTGLITNVRRALERFRAKHEGYLDAIGLADLERRLGAMDAGADFFGGGEPPDDASLAAWETVSRSTELYDLAFEGRSLYDAFFPTGSELRGWIGELQRHDRLDINLEPRAGAAFVPHVPWGLMYRLDLPEPGEPVDADGFLGLSLRLGYGAHGSDVSSKALGRLESVSRAFLLYWGDQPTDPTAVEARWQRDRWAAVPTHVVVPGDADGGQPKKRLMSLLRDPAPTPIRLLYFYCQCKVEQGNDPELRFANNTQPDNVVRRPDLGTADLAENPLVFANACTTSTADPFMSNELEAGFFRRKARAYLGTESKVPITLASRFAAVFFHYFDRRASDSPMAAGEAVHQARQFLWRHYRSLGGLFYTYVNQYELYMADDVEVRALKP